MQTPALPKKNAVLLIYGRTVYTDSEDWRAECEARMVAQMQQQTRVVYLQGVAANRGQAAADALLQHARIVYRFDRQPTTKATHD